METSDELIKNEIKHHPAYLNVIQNNNHDQKKNIPGNQQYFGYNNNVKQNVPNKMNYLAVPGVQPNYNKQQNYQNPVVQYQQNQIKNLAEANRAFQEN